MVTGVENAVQVHIDRGDDLNARDERGQTPLMLSAARNKAAICKLLLAAGADALLRDSSGRDALGIAQAAGALEAASAIEAAFVSFRGDALAPSEPASNDASRTDFAAPSARRFPPPTAIAVAPEADDEGVELDLNAWEAEESQTPPEADSTLAKAVTDLQTAISEHKPIDTSVGWDDFDASLPDHASPLSRAGDAEAREKLRLIVLRAIREGSVPCAAVEDLTRGDDGEPDAEARTLLTMVINDLGAETDERLEYWSRDETFEVFVAPDEKPDEEDAIVDTLAFLDDLSEHRNDPLRLYQRELQRETLLTAEAEVALGQAMERAIENALDALAGWPAGVALILNAARLVTQGDRPLRSMSSGPQIEPQTSLAAASSEIDANGEVDATLRQRATEHEFGGSEEADSESSLGVQESTDGVGEFCANAELLSKLRVGEFQHANEQEACRGVLASLRLTRSFLLEIAEYGLVGETQSARAFGQAMGAYRRARDRMVVANLKLVYSVARKYLFTGQPFEDLLQEGNMGLMKAVDRYDWRRGFKLSTYATWWIRQQVGRFVADKGNTIRVPAHLYEKQQRIAHAARSFESLHSRAPTPEELAVLVGLPVRKVERLSSLGLEPLPLHELPDIDCLIAAHAKDQFAVKDPLECVVDTQLSETVGSLLRKLKPKEESVLRMRHGVGVQDALTLEEIGTQMGVTRERIRQIEAKALRRLQHPARLIPLLTDLGLGTTQGPRQCADLPSDVDNDRGSTPETAKAISSKREPPARVAPRPEWRAASDLTALDKLLHQAREAGVVVEDRIHGGARQIWVHMTTRPDSLSKRKIVRRLIALGFDFLPGQGYRR